MTGQVNVSAFGDSPARALLLLVSLQEVASDVSVVCSVILAFFGVLLISDRFHSPSNLLCRIYFGLRRAT
jgi:hypothetical protein